MPKTSRQFSAPLWSLRMCLFVVLICHRAAAATSTCESAFIDIPPPSPFSVITHDLASISIENVRRIGEALDRRKWNREKPTTALISIQRSIDSRIVAVHSMDLERALSAFKDGELLSHREQERRGNRKASSNLSSATNLEYDGKIGERDVVFLALYDRDHQGSWGHVKIQFRKEAVLEMGYTTPFAFTVGLMDKFIRGSELTPEVRLQSMIPAYRSFIFKGLEGYRSLLALSVKSHFERPTGSREAPLDFTEVRDEFLMFPTESGATAYATGISPTGFWELKVPISVPLRLAENVSFPETLVDRYTDTNTNRSWEVLRPTHKLQTAIESYARKSGLDFEKEINGGVITYRFSEFRPL